MNADEELKIVQDCTEIIMSLNHCSDTHEYEKSVSHYTPDGIYVAGDKSHQGHEALLKMYKARSPTVVSRHLVTNVRVSVKDGSNAEAISYYLAFIVDPKVPDPKLPLPLEVFSMGEWNDTFIRTPQGWKLSRHEINRVYMREQK